VSRRVVQTKYHRTWSEKEAAEEHHRSGISCNTPRSPPRHAARKPSGPVPGNLRGATGSAPAREGNRRRLERAQETSSLATALAVTDDGQDEAIHRRRRRDLALTLLHTGTPAQVQAERAFKLLGIRSPRQARRFGVSTSRLRRVSRAGRPWAAGTGGPSAAPSTRCGPPAPSFADRICLAPPGSWPKQFEPLASLENTKSEDKRADAVRRQER